MKLCETAVLIPAYKPETELTTVVEGLFSVGFATIIVVDDGSGTEFQPLFDSLSNKATILHHLQNQGKGAALKTGIKYISEHTDCKALVACDADGQHKCADIKRVAELIPENEKELVMGSRRFTGKVPLRSRLGNGITRGVYHLASGVRVRDTQTGLRGFSRELFGFMSEIPGNRYEYEINMLLKTAKSGIKITETDIETVYLNGNSSSHFHAVRDSLIIYGNIIRFSFSSLLCFLIDFALLMLLSFLTKGMTEKYSLLISVVGARAISSLCNYLINRSFVFRNGGKITIVKYYALVVFIAASKYLLLKLFNLIFGVQLAIANIICEVVLFFVSFTVQKYLIFHKKGS